MMKCKKFILFVFVWIFVWIEMSHGATPLELLISKQDLPGGWVLIDGPHLYTKKTLFEHIDGQAELFFKYGFQKSVFAIYQNKKNQENQIELDIYDMENVLQAFGIFSGLRNEDRFAGIGMDSYLDDYSALFCKGRYFVMFYSTESNPSLLKQWAEKIALKIGDTSPPPKEIGYFPKNGLKAGSIQYFPEGLLGHQFLKRGFQGTYVEKVEVKDKVKAKAEDKAEDKAEAEAEDKEHKLFLAIFKNPQDAVNVLRTYKNYLTQKGKVHSDPSIGFGPSSFRGEDPYQGQIIVVQKANYLLGAIGFEKAKQGDDRLTEFVKGVK